MARVTGLVYGSTDLIGATLRECQETIGNRSQGLSPMEWSYP